MILLKRSPFDDEVIPAFCPQFLKYTVDMEFHGSLAQGQFASDFLVGQPASNQKHNFVFARAQRLRPPVTQYHVDGPTHNRAPKPKKLKSGRCKSCAVKLPRGDTLGAQAHRQQFDLIAVGQPPPQQTAHWLRAYAGAPEQNQ